MALPQTLAPAAPLGSSSPQNGDDELRGIKQFLADVFGLPVSPTDIHTKVMNVTEEGCVALAIRKTEYYTSGPQTLNIDHEFVVLNSASDATLNLPQASVVCTANGGKVYFILNISTGTWTINPYSGNTTEITTLKAGEGCILLCLNNGPKWWAIRVSSSTVAGLASSLTMDGEASAAASAATVNLDLGTVKAGDRFDMSGGVLADLNAGSYVSLDLHKTSGTSTGHFLNSYEVLGAIYTLPSNVSQNGVHVAGPRAIWQVDTDGTLTMQTYAYVRPGTGTITSTQIYAYRLKKG